MGSSLTSHYVAHALIIANVRLKRENTKGADERRENLIGELESITNPDEKIMIGQCLDILKNTDWYNIENVKAFRNKYYDEIHSDWLKSVRKH